MDSNTKKAFSNWKKTDKGLKREAQNRLVNKIVEISKQAVSQDNPMNSLARTATFRHLKIS